MSHPFDGLAPIPEQSWQTRCFRRSDARVASAVLERMLARIAPRAPTADEVSGIYRHFRISPRRARPVSIALWSRMFHHCRRHGVGSEEERRYLRALLEAFNLRECDVEMRRAGEATSVARPGKTSAVSLLTSSASPANLSA